MKALSGLIALVAVGIWVNALAAPSDFTTYTSPSGKFRFKYTAALVMCVRQDSHSKFQDYPWEPEDCQDWAEGCGYESGPAKTIVCLAFPKSDLKRYLKFHAGTVSVAEVTDRASERACFDLSEYLAAGQGTDQVRIDNVTFIHVDWASTGGGHGDFHSTYRSFHAGTCYQIETTIDSVGDVFDMTPEERKAYWAEDDSVIKSRLHQVVETFQFLK